MKNFILLVLWVCISVSLIIGLNGAFGKIPAIGSLLDPVTGLYYTARTAEPDDQIAAKIPGLAGEVVVIRDERSVPHIFASHDMDAVTALGYVVARDRLFQMDFIPRVAAGRLSEILGSSMLETDRFLRQTGMEWGAQKNLQRIRGNQSFELEPINAYVRGVNAYLDQLEPKDYPIEMKLLGYKPERYTPMHVLRILQYMTFDLTYRSDDAVYSELKQLLGGEAYKSLFPEYAKLFVPIIPEKGGQLPAQEKRVVYSSNEAGLKDASFPDITSAAGIASNEKGSTVLARKKAFQDGLAGTPLEGYIPGKGSNNWAVGPTRSVTEAPIIAGDMHLSLWLPSIWYEVHMVSPGMNTYGVTIPGAPLPVEAFNEHVGWAFTNTGSDQIDHLKLTLNDAGNQYLYNGAYRDLTLDIDTFRVKGAAPVVDTLFYAHWGPVTIDDEEAIALNWVAHDSSRTLLALWNMNRARSFDEFQDATRYWDTPMQNIIYGDVDGNIAIRATGYLPIRKAGHGMGLLDGSTDAFEWIGRVPFDELPYSFNPAQGFLTSTNQQPADSLYPYYQGHNWRPGYRSLRIDALFNSKEQHDVKDLKKYQSDVYVVQRDLFATLLEDVDTLSPKADELKQMLLNWEGIASVDRPEPLVMDIYLKYLGDLVWDEPMFTEFQSPTEEQLYEVLTGQDDAVWLDIQGTEQEEGSIDILRLALEHTADSLSSAYGWGTEHWRWGDHHKVVFRHFTRSEALAGLWRGPFEYPGFASTLSPARGLTTTHSASWRMVVDFSTQPPTGYGVYPGGQSGNPFSEYYDKHLDTYLNFKHYSLYRPRIASDFAPDRIISTTSISPE